MGVWIEIAAVIEPHIGTESLPVWECGLKFLPRAAGTKPCESLPVWECGLKCQISGNCPL